MTVQWEKAYVFISSTFNDMHAERDYLVKQVFPQLAEWCERRKLRLVDIDLRWGVTEADAAENRRAVQVCLERIDTCRPFFLCFLGQRRGWVPAKDDISLETYAQYPGLERYAGDTSVTELEILHALVNPLHRGKLQQAQGGAKECAPAEHSFFYLRQPQCLAALPTDLPQLRQVYTNEGIQDSAERRSADQQLERWRTVEIPATGRPVHPYQAHWDAKASTPEIRLPLYCPSTAERSSPAWRSALARWAGQWAQAGVRVDDGGEIADPAEREKAERFNARLTRGRLAEFTCSGQSLADAILGHLQAAIKARYPEHIETAGLTPLQRELDQQEQFLQVAGEGFIEREGDFRSLDRYAEDASRQALFMSAPAGLGKTSLLARWIDRTQLNLEAGESLHYRFISASDGSTTVDALLRSLLGEIKDVAGKLDEEIPAEPDKLRAALPALLEAAGKHGKTVIVLDGLNQLESSLGDLSWLPLALPPGVKLVASCKRGEPQAEAYFEQLRAGGQAILAEVQPFASLEDRRKLVGAYLSQFLKELDERHLEALIRSEGAGNPLYLKVVLAELRVFGAFADLGARIRSGFGVTPVSAFGGLLRRLESDPAYSPAAPERLVPRIFGWLAHARTGLSVEELGGLLVREGLLPDDEPGRQQATEAVHGLLRQVRPYLSRREGRAGFFYESFKLAVLERYAAPERVGAHPEARSARAWHGSLAEYFDDQPLRLGAERAPNRHKLAELAFQLAHAGMTEALGRTLWGYPYVQARLEGSDVGALIADYDLANLDEAGLGMEARQRLGLLQGTLRLSAHVLGGDPAQLPSQLAGRLLGQDEQEVTGLLEAAQRETSRPWLRPLSAGLTRPRGALVRTLSGHSGGVYTVAVTPDGRRAVSGSDDETLKVWDLESGAELTTLRGHSKLVRAVAVTPDGRRAVSGSWDRTLKVWDLASGRVLRTLYGQFDGVNAVAVTPDGRRVVSGSEDNTLNVWDLESLEWQMALRGHAAAIRAVAVTRDGRRAVSGSEDRTLKVWDLESGAELVTLRGHRHDVHAVAVTPDGRRVVSGSYDETLKVWDLESGAELTTLLGHRYEVDAVAVTPDGRQAVSGAEDKTLKVWDLESGTELATLPGHSSKVWAVALTPDGRRVISGSGDGTLKVWDIRAALHGGLESGAAPAALRGHSDSVNAVVVTPDGRRAVSGSWDNTLKVWDLASGAELTTLRGHGASIRAVKVTPDGRRAVSASWDCTLKVWNLESGVELATLAGHGTGITAVAITPDGRRAVSGSFDDTLKVWDLESGAELATLRGHTDDVETVAVTPDGRRVVSGSRDKTLKVWDLASRASWTTLLGHSGAVTAVAITPDGHRAVSGSSDHTLKVWDLEGWKEMASLLGHRGAVWAVAVTPDGRRAVSGSTDHTLKVWDLESGCEVATFSDDGHLNACDACPDGVTMLAGGARGWLHLLRMENLVPGPAVVTAWQKGASTARSDAPWQQWRRPPGTQKQKAAVASPAFGCPHCHTWSEVPESALGSELPCPSCGRQVWLNPFVVEADWRPVAAAWKGEG